MMLGGRLSACWWTGCFTASAEQRPSAWKWKQRWKSEPGVIKSVPADSSPSGPSATNNYMPPVARRAPINRRGVCRLVDRYLLAGRVPLPVGVRILGPVFGMHGAPPLGFFAVLRSRRVTFCFLLLAGCFVFMGTLCFCGYDLLKGLVRTA